MAKRKEVYVDVSEFSRRAAKSLDDSLERWLVRKEREEKERKERQQPRDYLYPPSHELAVQWDSELSNSLSEVQWGLSGFIKTDSHGVKQPNRANPERRKLVTRHKELLKKKSQLKIYLRAYGKIHDDNLADYYVVKSDLEMTELVSKYKTLKAELISRNASSEEWGECDKIKKYLYHEIATRTILAKEKGELAVIKKRNR
jgi:hypothetical protein